MLARGRLPLFAAVLIASVALADNTWQRTEVKHGVTYDKRSVPGSKFNEYRAEFDIAITPQRALDVLWQSARVPPGPHILKRTVIKATESDLVFHDDIKTKVVSDRELTLRMWREPDAIRFEARPELGPAPVNGHIALTAVRGSWVITPSGNGAHVVYICYSEPGGSVPAFLVRGTQQEQVVKDVEHTREQWK